MAHISSYLRLFSSLRTNRNPKTFVQVKLGARTSYELTCTPSYVSAQSHFRFAKLQSMQTDAMPWSLLFSQTEQPNNLRHLFWQIFFSCLFHGDGGFSLFIERPVRVREKYFAHLNGLLHRL